MADHQRTSWQEQDARTKRRAARVQPITLFGLAVLYGVMATTDFLGEGPVTWHTWVRVAVAIVSLPTSVVLWRRLDRDNRP